MININTYDWLVAAGVPKSTNSVAAGPKRLSYIGSGPDLTGFLISLQRKCWSFVDDIGE